MRSLSPCGPITFPQASTWPTATNGRIGPVGNLNYAIAPLLKSEGTALLVWAGIE